MVFYVTDKLGQRRLSLRSLSSYPPGETYAALAIARVSRDNTSYNTTYLNFPIASDTSVREVYGEVAVDVVLCRDRSQETCKYGIWYIYRYIQYIYLITNVSLALVRSCSVR